MAARQMRLVIRDVQMQIPQGMVDVTPYRLADARGQRELIVSFEAVAEAASSLDVAFDERLVELEEYLDDDMQMEQRGDCRIAGLPGKFAAFVFDNGSLRNQCAMWRLGNEYCHMAYVTPSAEPALEMEHTLSTVGDRDASASTGHVWTWLGRFFAEVPEALQTPGRFQFATLEEDMVVDVAAYQADQAPRMLDDWLEAQIGDGAEVIAETAAALPAGLAGESRQFLLRDRDSALTPELHAVITRAYLGNTVVFLFVQGEQSAGTVHMSRQLLRSLQAVRAA